MTMKQALSCTAAVTALSLSTAVAFSQTLESPWQYAARQPPPQRPTSDFLQPELPVTSWNPLRFAVAFEGQTRWQQDNAAKRLAGTRSPTSGGVTAQAEILQLTNKTAARVDLGWTTFSALNPQESAGNTMSNERLKTNVITLGLSARYAVLPWLSPYLRLAGGIGWDKLEVGEGSGAMHDRQVFSQGSAGAGLMLRSPGLRFWQSASAPFLGFVAQIEGGYTLASGSDFALQSSPSGSGQGTIPTSTVALGHVNRSAPYLRFTAGLAF
jgi:hypothetical protein